MKDALARGPVVPVFIWSPEEEAPWAPGAASRWWLHHSLAALDASLRRKGSYLLIKRGPAAEALAALARETGADTLAFHRRVEPTLRRQESRVEKRFRSTGGNVAAHEGALLFPPAKVKTAQGNPYQVFTPFWNNLRGLPHPPPLDAPARVPSPPAPRGESLESLGLLPRIPWDERLHGTWTPGEIGARKKLNRFSARANNYVDGRDRPAEEGVSRLSPHLHFGEISPRQAWRAVPVEAYRRQLAWREFAHHLLFHFPRTAEEPLRPAFRRFPWRKDPEGMKSWRMGKTGYPWVDAGMRELWATGWMHNRVRMAAASFLVKDLLISWREGAAWFWDTLVDADLANNTLGWQWTAGCGADAAPYFRVFNPSLQGERFDPEGGYVRRWIPALKEISNKEVHRPWTSGKNPRDYPPPILDHDEARQRALIALTKTKL